MELKDYLDLKDMGVSAFAKIANMKQPYLSLIARKKRVPSPKMALRIQEASNGEVTVMELLFPDKSKKKAARKKTQRGADKNIRVHQGLNTTPMESGPSAQNF